MRSAASATARSGASFFRCFRIPGRLRVLAWPLGLYQKSGLRRLVHASGVLQSVAEAAAGDGTSAAAHQFWHRRYPRARAGKGHAAAPAWVFSSGACSACFSAMSTRRPCVCSRRKAAKSSCRAQACCGALAEHAGEEADAMAAARRLIDAFEHADVDTIVINAAGCGSAMKRYGHLLRNDPAYAERAKAFGAKCRDISEVLTDLEPRAPRGPVPLKLAYHDACHLQHAQGVRAQPRQLLQAIPGVEVREIRRIGNLLRIGRHLQPARARPGNRAARSQSAEHPQTDAEAIVSGNPGCLLQIATGLEEAGRPLRDHASRRSARPFDPGRKPGALGALVR